MTYRDRWLPRSARELPGDEQFRAGGQAGDQCGQIDSSHPDMNKRLPAGESFTHGRGRWLLRAAQWRLRPLGLVRLADDLGFRRQNH